MEDIDAILAERLRLLAQQVSELDEYQAVASSFQVYTGNRMLRRAVERALQVTTEVCLDIGRRIGALEGFRYPETNQDVFRILAEESIIPQNLSSTMLDIARFRNLIVYDYAKINDAKVYEILKHRLGDFDAFAKAVAAYLEGE